MLSRTKRRLARPASAIAPASCRAGCRICRSFSTRSITPKASTRSSRTSARSTACRRWRRSASSARAHLRPGGAVVLGLMGRTCLWEIALLHRPRRTARGGAAGGESNVAVPVAGVDVPTFYHRTATCAAALGDGLHARRHDRHRRDGAAAVPRTALAAGAGGDSPRRRRRRSRRRSWPLVNQLGDHTLTRWVKSAGDAMPDVLLGQAYYLRFDPKLWQAQQPYPPLGTLYAASYLRERGHQRRVVRRDAGGVGRRMGRGARARIGRASPCSTKTTSTT